MTRNYRPQQPPQPQQQQQQQRPPALPSPTFPQFPTPPPLNTVPNAPRIPLDNRPHFGQRPPLQDPGRVAPVGAFHNQIFRPQSQPQNAWGAQPNMPPNAFLTRPVQQRPHIDMRVPHGRVGPNHAELPGAVTHPPPGHSGSPQRPTFGMNGNSQQIYPFRPTFTGNETGRFPQQPYLNPPQQQHGTMFTPADPRQQQFERNALQNRGQPNQVGRPNPGGFWRPPLQQQSPSGFQAPLHAQKPFQHSSPLSTADNTFAQNDHRPPWPPSGPTQLHPSNLAPPADNHPTQPKNEGKKSKMKGKSALQKSLEGGAKKANQNSRQGNDLYEPLSRPTFGSSDNFDFSFFDNDTPTPISTESNTQTNTKEQNQPTTVDSHPLSPKTVADTEGSNFSMVFSSLLPDRNLAPPVTPLIAPHIQQDKPNLVAHGDHLGTSQQVHAEVPQQKEAANRSRKYVSYKDRDAPAEPVIDFGLDDIASTPTLSAKSNSQSSPKQQESGPVPAVTDIAISTLEVPSAKPSALHRAEQKSSSAAPYYTPDVEGQLMFPRRAPVVYDDRFEDSFGIESAGDKRKRSDPGGEERPSKRPDQTRIPALTSVNLELVKWMEDVILTILKDAVTGNENNGIFNVWGVGAKQIADARSLALEVLKITENNPKDIPTLISTAFTRVERSSGTIPTWFTPVNQACWYIALVAVFHEIFGRKSSVMHALDEETTVLLSEAWVSIQREVTDVVMAAEFSGKNAERMRLCMQVVAALSPWADSPIPIDERSSSNEWIGWLFDKGIFQTTTTLNESSVSNTTSSELDAASSLLSRSVALALCLGDPIVLKPLALYLQNAIAPSTVSTKTPMRSNVYNVAGRILRELCKSGASPAEQILRKSFGGLPPDSGEDSTVTCEFVRWILSVSVEANGTWMVADMSVLLCNWLKDAPTRLMDWEGTRLACLRAAVMAPMIALICRNEGEHSVVDLFPSLEQYFNENVGTMDNKRPDPQHTNADEKDEVSQDRPFGSIHITVSDLKHLAQCVTTGLAQLPYGNSTLGGAVKASSESGSITTMDPEQQKAIIEISRRISIVSEWAKRYGHVDIDEELSLLLEPLVGESNILMQYIQLLRQ